MHSGSWCRTSSDSSPYVKVKASNSKLVISLISMKCQTDAHSQCCRSKPQGTHCQAACGYSESFVQFELSPCSSIVGSTIVRSLTRSTKLIFYPIDASGSVRTHDFGAVYSCVHKLLVVTKTKLESSSATFSRLFVSYRKIRNIFNVSTCMSHSSEERRTQNFSYVLK